MKNKKLISILVGAGVLIAIISVGAWLLLTERLVIAWHNGDTNLASENQTTANVCADSTVDVYNQLITSDATDQTKLDALADEIKLRDGYRNDATCQTILFWIAADADRSGEVTEAFRAVKRLHQQGIYANSNLRNTMAVSLMEGLEDALQVPVDERGIGG